VLDAGCGSGQDLIPFASQGLTCVGGDIAYANAVWATQQFGTHYPHLAVRFATSAVEHLPFRATFFDVVLCRHAQRLPGPPSRGFMDRFEALRRAPMPGSLPSPYRVLTRRIVRE
jgi:SAM-dependent methyltransferase